jgi:hypothetical protein
MWLRAEGKVAFSTADAPEWVREWQSRRRGPGKPSAAADRGADKKAVSLAASSETTAEKVDPKAEARAAAARGRNRLDREASIRAGLDELDLWLEDQVQTGTAAFVAKSSAACRAIAQRLVDAKAPGLAGRLDRLPARLFSMPEASRPLAALEELGQLHLLADAYRRQDELAATLRADVRQAVGWAVARETLLEDAQAERVRGAWRVVAVLSEVQPDKLRRVETWLSLEGTARFALLLDFVPVATGGAASGYVVGERLEAELLFYPSAAPLRALVAQSSGSQPSNSPLDIPAARLRDACDAYQTALQMLPWIDCWPLSFRSARIRRSGKALLVCDSAGGSEALPVAPAQWDFAGPLLALQQIDGAGIWDGRYCTLCWAETELGRWVNA